MHILIITTLICAVTSMQLYPPVKKTNGLDDSQNDPDLSSNRWSWGVANEITIGDKNKPTEPTIIDVTTEPDPCLPVTYTKPDFTAMGQRISESKCFEYIWEMKHRAELANRSNACFLYKMKHSKYTTPPTFVVGGRNTARGEFPHMGALGWKTYLGTWSFQCGSTLISAKFILTAAHCSRVSSRDTTFADSEPKIVRLGSKNIQDTPEDPEYHDENIIKIIIHPSYKPPRKYFDIALMELENEVVFTKNMQPACLWSTADLSSLGSIGMVTGWGLLQKDDNKNHPELQAAELDLINTTKCNELLWNKCTRMWCGVADHQICAGKLAGGVDACRGDSGGPIQSKIPLLTKNQGNMYYVFGVTSFGIGCAQKDLPGMYSRVSSFIDWIEEIVWL